MFGGKYTQGVRRQRCSSVSTRRCDRTRTFCAETRHWNQKGSIFLLENAASVPINMRDFHSPSHERKQTSRIQALYGALFEQEISIPLDVIKAWTGDDFVFHAETR